MRQCILEFYNEATKNMNLGPWQTDPTTKADKAIYLINVCYVKLVLAMVNN